MSTLRWVLAIPLAVVAFTAGAQARASTIRDNAGMFSPGAVKEAESRLDRIERATGVPVVIETIKSIPSLTKESSKDERERAINQTRRAEGQGDSR